jgi:hypothetical protein
MRVGDAMIFPAIAPAPFFPKFDKIRPFGGFWQERWLPALG